MTFATIGELEDFTDAKFTVSRAELALQLASGAVESAAKTTHATIVKTDREDLLDGTGTSVLTLPSWPVSDVTAVEIDGEAVTDFTWSRNGVLERDDKNWPQGRRNIKVSATYGFADEDVPTEIKAVTLQAAARAILNPARLNSFSDGQVSVGFGGGGVGTQVLDLLPGERDMVVRAVR